MNIAIPKKKGGKLYFLTNEGLKVGDEVFPIVSAFHEKGRLFVTDIIRTHEDDPFNVDACTGWPLCPHIIRDFYKKEGLSWIHTDKGYSPAEVYFKIFLPN